MVIYLDDITNEDIDLNRSIRPDLYSIYETHHGEQLKLLDCCFNQLRKIEEDIFYLDKLRKCSDNFGGDHRLMTGMTLGYSRPTHATDYIESTGISNDVPNLNQDDLSSLRENGYLMMANIFEKSNEYKQLRNEVNDFISSIDHSEKVRFLDVPSALLPLMKLSITPDIQVLLKAYLNSEQLFIYSPKLLCSNEEAGINLDEMKASSYAFAYHRDMDALRFVKVFVQLNKPIGSGFHNFIRGSHRLRDTETRSALLSAHQNNYLLHTPMHYMQFKPLTEWDTHLCLGRFNRDSILNIFGESKEIKIGGEQGMTWVEDTYGLHKGSPIYSGTRLILSILVCSQPFL